MARSGIYRIQIGENFYFGSAINLKNRERKHRGELRSGRHSNRWMQNAWNRHGEMHFEAIEHVDPERLIEREQVHISQWFNHPRCMNLSPTAGSTLGVRHTDEARRNMSIAHIGKQRGMDHPMFGKKHSPETRERLRAAQTGRKFTEETRAKQKASLNRPGVKIRMRMTHLGRKQSAEWVENRMRKQRGANNVNARSVRLFLPDGSSAVHPTVVAAAGSIGVRHHNLTRWLNGTNPWPGEGRLTKGKSKNLKGLKGEYLS